LNHTTERIGMRGSHVSAEGKPKRNNGLIFSNPSNFLKNLDLVINNPGF